METLMGSCWKIFPLKFGEKDRLIWRPGDGLQSRNESGLFRNQKRDLFPGFSFHCKTVRSVSYAAPENQTLVESEGTDQKLVADQPKTARVRFKLTKECAFGQHFMIVGDDSCLGLWDPSDGVWFTWSDGHVWTAEIDVPCGKVIKYKFILRLDDKTIFWQPGPDRFLETWETEKTIVVFEDWDHPGFQEIVEEEELIADLNDDKSFISSEELLTVSENLSRTTQDEGTDAEKQLDDTDELSSLHDKVKQDSATYINCSKHEESSVLEQEAPVLLPDLIPMLPDETDEESPNEVKNKELKAADNSASLQCTETGKVLIDKVKQDSTTYINSSKREESSVLEQEAPVLLPDLIPRLPVETDEESPNEVKDDELKGAHNSASLQSTKTGKVLIDKVKQDSTTYINSSKHEESSVLEKEAPVLLPDLIPRLPVETDEETPNEVKDEELKAAHNSASLQSTETGKVLIDKVKQDSTAYINSSKHEESSDLEQEAPVLLPGLIPRLPDETDEESQNEVKDELKAAHNSASLRSTETGKVLIDKKGFYGKEQREILKGNKQWRRVMVQKFLEILGF